jgi:uncharacterized protein YdeI (YjbR/CyaY-like superfamily)
MITVAARTATDWRAWLAEHGQSATEIWLVIHNKASGVPSVRYHESIEHALCYGWIDSHARKHDAGSVRLRFTPRRARSTWSAVNRERAARMISQGLMTEPGQAMIDLAKRTGTWQPLPDSAGSTIPDDLRTLLSGNPIAQGNFDGFPPSAKRLILEWIATAKRPETRQRRLERTVTLAAENLRAR